MVLSKRAIVLAALIALAITVAGCDSPSATTSGLPPVKPTAPFITVASVSLDGKAQAVLTTATGLTLYYDAKDTATASACTSACTSDWRPLLFAGPGAPIAPPALPGALSLIHDGSGDQVAYNGHRLYTYAKDANPGQAGGQGYLGQWFVATPSLRPNR